MADARQVLLDECLPALVHLYTAPTAAAATVAATTAAAPRRPVGRSAVPVAQPAAEQKAAGEEGAAAADAARCLCNLAGDGALGLDPALVVLPLLPLPPLPAGGGGGGGGGGAAVQRCVAARLAEAAGEGGERAQRLVDGPGLDVLITLLRDLAPLVLSRRVALRRPRPHPRPRPRPRPRPLPLAGVVFGVPCLLTAPNSVSPRTAGCRRRRNVFARRVRPADAGRAVPATLPHPPRGC